MDYGLEKGINLPKTGTLTFNSKGKRILLIAPYGNLPVYWFPLALGYLKSNLQDHHEVKILDCTNEDIRPRSSEFKKQLQKFKPDVVGVSTASITYHYALEALKVTKSLNSSTITVMGGAHPTIYADSTMKNDCVDFCFKGESELSFPIFIDQLDQGDFSSDIKGLVYRKNGKVIHNAMELEPNIDKIKIPDYGSLNLNGYLAKGYNYGGLYGKTAPIWVTRGCPYRCQFCSAPQVNGRKMRAHTTKYLRNWIDHLYNEFDIRQFAIVDDQFTFDVPLAKEYCREFIELRKSGHFAEDIYFTTPNGIRMERVDEELLRLMKEAGWVGVTIAPESGSRKVLKRMQKGLNPDIVPGVVEKVKKAGLSARGFFMVGYPGETMEDLDDTKKLIRKCRFDSLVIGRFNPFPGTPIFDELVKNGDIPPDYLPPQVFKLFLPFQKKITQELYSPPGFENFSLFRMLLWEHILMAIRNPKSIRYFFKYYGFKNFIRKLYDLVSMPDDRRLLS